MALYLEHYAFLVVYDDLKFFTSNI